MVAGTGTTALYFFFAVTMTTSSGLRMSPHPFPKPASSSATPTKPIDLSFVESSGCGSVSAAASASASASSDAPTTLFIHGLDSSSHTWRGVQESLPTPSIAIDCRGCGRSALGEQADFAPDSVADDIKRLVDAHPLLRDHKFVIVGHSMGGRVGMSYTAKYPGDVAALVVEDMDTRRRSVQSNFIPNFDDEKAIAFERRHATFDDVRKSFADIGYPPDMVEKWIDEGRVYAISEDNSKGKSTSVWSDVNPAFRALCYRTIFDSDCGSDAWTAISDHLLHKGNGISVHLMVAGIGTVCDDASIQDMQKSMGKLLSVKTYPKGTHSIHNSVRDEFMADLLQVIEGTSVQKKELRLEL